MYRDDAQAQWALLCPMNSLECQHSKGKFTKDGIAADFALQICSGKIQHKIHDKARG